jgi:glyoxylase-like metal-dependent hydrolase (beta-lactamase superfamily II)
MKLAGGVGTMSWDIGGVRYRQLEGSPADPGVQSTTPPSLTHLAASGFPPETIDLVVCTHLHVDHVGWNTHLVNGEWIPAFARARYPIQCRHPEWTARGDADPDAARTTRRPLLVAAATTNALVLGTHFTGTAAGRILSTDQG